MRTRTTSQKAEGVWACRSAAIWPNVTAVRWTLSEPSPARAAYSFYAFLRLLSRRCRARQSGRKGDPVSVRGAISVATDQKGGRHRSLAFDFDLPAALERVRQRQAPGDLLRYLDSSRGSALLPA